MRRLELLFLVLGAGLFLLLLRQIGFSSLVSLFGAQRFRFLLVLVPTGISYVLFCVAWYLVLDPEARRVISFPYLFLVSMAGFSLNYVTPLIPLGGEPLRMILLSRSLGKQRAVSSVIAYNALHVLSHLLIFFLACVLGFTLLRGIPGHWTGMVAGAAVSAGLAVILLTFHERGAAVRGLGLLRRIPALRISEGRAARWLERLDRYHESVSSFYRTRRKEFWIALAVDFVGRTIWATEVAIMLDNIGHRISLLQAFFIHSVGSMLMVLTFFIPYELGAREGWAALCLQWCGLDPSLGVYVGVASRLREFLWIIVGFSIMAGLGLRGATVFDLMRGKRPLDKEAP
jgi:uncharacterized membrane protein YbhN (UPF0104 family)